MAESSKSAAAGQPSGLRGLVNRAGRLPEWVDRRIAPVAVGLQSLAGGLGTRSRPALPVAGPDYHLIAGVRRGQGRVAASVIGGELRLLQHARGRVIGWGSLPLPEGTAKEGVVVDSAGLGAALETSFDQLRLPRRHVSSAIPGLGVGASLLELPWVKEDELAEVVADEASRALGASPDESFLFWQRLTGRRRDRFVYVVVVPREPLLLLLEAYEAGGLRLDLLDLKPLSLARAVNQRDAIILNLEDDCLDVAVVADDLPILLRSVALPDGYGRGESVHDLAVDEVVRALQGYDGAAASHHLGADTAIYLTGRAAGSVLLADRLRARTGRPIGRVVVPLHCPSDFPLDGQLVNVGLVLKGP